MTLRRSPRKHASTMQCDKLKKKQKTLPAITSSVKEEEEETTALRRSSRDTNAIRFKGTAQTFYRRLQTLFFLPHFPEKLVGTLLQNVHRTPNLYVLEDFLLPSELEYFDAIFQQCPFERSFVDNMQKKPGQRGTIIDSNHRTSTFFSFKKLHNTKISALEQRIANLFGCWNHQIEPLQLVRYMPGQFFGVHHDMGDLLDDDSVVLPKKHPAVKRRLVTLFIYLNALDENQGGCTHFPNCNNLRVQPKRGRAVLWSNVTAEGSPDPYTIHAGEPVFSNDKKFAKYGLNIWICEE